MMQKHSRLTLLAFASISALALSCASTSESASSDNMTSHVGRYDAPPPGLPRPRLGVPPFEVTGKNAKREMNEVAADQATTLFVNTQRFNVIERAQLSQLLTEQGLEGVVRADQLAQSGQVQGVDLLLIGKITNLRAKTTRAKRGLGLAKIGLGDLGIGGGDFKKDDVEITTECGVDIRLVDPSTGAIVVSDFSEYNRKDKASAIGVEILGVNATADADMQISEDDYGKILRLALDDAVRKVLPSIDNYLMSQR